MLDQNVSDLQPRNHLYLTAGVTNLSLAFPLDTTALSDGSHELTAVIYEGSHVRTQVRVTQSVCVQNTPLSATFTTLAGASNTVLDFTLLFSVVANTNTISQIELFTTGGSVGIVSNQSSATFTVAAANLGIGLHPFYAVVTRNDGKQYRTETKWIRIGGAEPPFGLTLAALPPVIAWPATAGRLYEVLSATNVTDISNRAARSRRRIPPAFGLIPSRMHRNSFIVSSRRDERFNQPPSASNASISLNANNCVRYWVWVCGGLWSSRSAPVAYARGGHQFARLAPGH